MKNKRNVFLLLISLATVFSSYAMDQAGALSSSASSFYSAPSLSLALYGEQSARGMCPKGKLLEKWRKSEISQQQQPYFLALYDSGLSGQERSKTIKVLRQLYRMKKRLLQGSGVKKKTVQRQKQQRRQAGGTTTDTAEKQVVEIFCNGRKYFLSCPFAHDKKKVFFSKMKNHGLGKLIFNYRKSRPSVRIFLLHNKDGSVTTIIK